jgi:hypothetical protein
MGTNVDVYQRAEGRYRLMPEILTALRDFANPFSVLTKGTLILRDLELLKQAASVTDVSLAMSIGFVDERMWRAVESGTPSPRRRLDALARLTDAGFSVGVPDAPILPGLTDTDESIEETVAAIAARARASVTPLPLHLRPGAREWYAAWLTREHPSWRRATASCSAGGSYSPQATSKELGARVPDGGAPPSGLRRGEPAIEGDRTPAGPGRTAAAAPRREPSSLIANATATASAAGEAGVPSVAPRGWRQPAGRCPTHGGSIRRPRAPSDS